MISFARSPRIWNPWTPEPRRPPGRVQRRHTDHSYGRVNLARRNETIESLQRFLQVHDASDGKTRSLWHGCARYIQSSRLWRSLIHRGAATTRTSGRWPRTRNLWPISARPAAPETSASTAIQAMRALLPHRLFLGSFHGTPERAID
jgi:hypothetical protein